MFNLFKKTIGPKVYWIEYTVIKTGQSFNSLRDGYTLEEIQEELDLEYKGGVTIGDNLSCELQALLDKYSEERQALKQLKQ